MNAKVTNMKAKVPPKTSRDKKLIGPKGHGHDGCNYGKEQVKKKQASVQTTTCITEIVNDDDQMARSATTAAATASCSYDDYYHGNNQPWL
jgi:hypothetical protein